MEMCFGFFLFTGCYPTRAFWGHVHSSWRNLSPSEYPGQLKCVFFYVLFSAHLLSTFTIQVISHSSREDFKVVFILRENKSEANWMWSRCFMMMCKRYFQLLFFWYRARCHVRYNLNCRSPWLVFIRGVCFTALCLSTALQEEPVTAWYIMPLWLHQAHSPELPLKEDKTGERERAGCVWRENKILSTCFSTS